MSLSLAEDANYGGIRAKLDLDAQYRIDNPGGIRWGANGAWTRVTTRDGMENRSSRP